jgi:addiction module RelB/DinJ family antitoxin
MASKTTTINIRIDKKTKSAVQNIVEDLGLDISSAIMAFFKKVIQTESIPFILEKNGRMNNPRYLAELKEDVAWSKKHSKKYASAREAMSDILAE